MTDASGTVISSCTYAPFGEQVACSPDNTSNHYRFTSKERDSAESGLDYFRARHYSSAMGRFMTPDWSAGPSTVPYAHLENPQTLNLYAYVDNNPVNGIDPDGHAVQAMVYQAGSWGVDSMMSDGAGETGGSGEDGAAIDAYNAYASAYNQQNAQNQPLTAVTVLDTEVKISYAKELSASDKLAASNAIAASAGLINKNAASLTPDEKKAIAQVSDISVAGPKTALGATGKQGMTLTASYIKLSSAAWLGSLLGHEGQHHLNAGKYSGENLWKDEQSAGRTQLGIGNKIGFTKGEGTWLERWIDDKNRAVMQKHMEQGYSQ